MQPALFRTAKYIPIKPCFDNRQRSTLEEPPRSDQYFRLKEEKNGHLDKIMILVVGVLGSWMPENNDIKRALNIPNVK